MHTATASVRAGIRTKLSRTARRSQQYRTPLDVRQAEAEVEAEVEATANGGDAFPIDSDAGGGNSAQPYAPIGTGTQRVYGGVVAAQRAVDSRSAPARGGDRIVFA